MVDCVRPKVLSFLPLPQGGKGGGIASITRVILSDDKIRQCFKWQNVDLRDIKVPSEIWFKMLNRLYGVIKMRRWENLLLRKQLAHAHKQLSTFGPDLVYISFVQGHTFWLMGGIAEIARKMGAKVVVNYFREDFDIAFTAMSIREKRTCLKILNNVDMIIVSNDHARLFFLESVPKVKVVKLFSPVNANIFKPKNDVTRFIKRRGSFLVSFVGLNDAHNKGAYVLFEAIPKILQEIPDAKFIMVGPDTQGIRSKIQDKLGAGATCVTFPGVITFDEIRSLFQHSDVFVFPSYSEGFGLALVEAMSCGTACIGTRVGAVPEILDGGRYGLIIDPGDSHQLAEAVTKLARNSELRASIGKAARERVVTNYDVSHFSPAFCSILMSTFAGEIGQFELKFRDGQ